MPSSWPWPWILKLILVNTSGDDFTVTTLFSGDFGM